MHRNSFLGSVGSKCGICAIRALVFTAALIGPAVLPALSQERQQERVDPATETLPASRVPASPLLAARTSASPELLREAATSPFAERSLNFTSPRTSLLAHHADSRERLLHALSLEKQRTPFQSQVRLPIREFFGGRLELACVHTRTRHVGVHSAVPHSELGYRLHSPYSSSLLPRTRASLTLGLWFRLSGS